MRTKSDARRKAILSTAAAAFQENGFDATSMDDIAARTPCSKVTLYAYFDSKETLFYDAVVQALDAQFHELYGVLGDTEAPVEQVLTRFGERFISLICAADVQALRRLVMAAKGPGAQRLRRKCYEAGPKLALSMCSAYLRRCQAQGSLNFADSELAGMQLRALLEAEWMDPLFYRRGLKPSRTQIRASAQRATHAFLAINHSV